MTLQFWALLRKSIDTKKKKKYKYKYIYIRNKKGREKFSIPNI